MLVPTARAPPASQIYMPSASCCLVHMCQVSLRVLHNTWLRKYAAFMQALQAHAPEDTSP